MMEEKKEKNQTLSMFKCNFLLILLASYCIHIRILVLLSNANAKHRIDLNELSDANISSLEMANTTDIVHALLAAKVFHDAGKIFDKIYDTFILVN